MSEASEFVARVYQAINARDRTAIRALTGPDIVFATTVEAFRGPEALLEWMDDGDEAFDDFSVELLEVDEVGEHVVVAMRQRGRGKASGAEVDDHITHVWTLRGGRPTRLQSFANHDDAVRYAKCRGVVRVNGLEVAYQRAGAGPPLVLVHGAASDSRLWRPQLAELADEFTVVAWDEPGAGRSGEVPAGFGLADYAECLAELIEALELGPAHVAGLSWGGTVAQELYRRRPGTVATLILADTYAGWKGSLPEEELRARVAHAHAAFAAPREYFDPRLPGLLAHDPPEEAVAALEEMARDVRPESMATALTVMAETDQRDLLPSIDVPTLLVWGEHDARSPLSVARQLEQAIPDTTLVVIPDAGHVSNLEQPERFNAAVRDFCRAHDIRFRDAT